MENIKVKLPDGSKAQYKKMITVEEIAYDIGKNLGESAVAAYINGEKVDLDYSLTENAELKIITLDSPEGLNIYRHTASHVMAQAVKRLYNNVKLGIGPTIDDGFYYDFDMDKRLSEDDLRDIESEMEKIIAEKLKIEKVVMSKEEALEFMKSRGEKYKVELIQELEEKQVKFYRQGNFIDLCRGPHLQNTGEVKAFKLLNVAGAYWRGDERNEMLQRIYATAWPSEVELDDYLERLEEAKKRDHRKLGKEMELFHFSDTAPGMPYWLPDGVKLVNQLLDFWRVEHEKRGYQEISAPLLSKKELWETSGHWDYYQENMFIIEDNDNIYGVKPMNCPNAMVVYNLKTRSYRDLPLRIADCDVLHRNELSGTLHGLLRVQSFRQDDSHNFITEEQIKAEVARILDITDLFYSIFGMKYTPSLSTRPENFMGDAELWDKAEEALKEVLDNRFEQYQTEEGEGAFYGPKIDIMMEDSLSRVWQMGTIQLDFQLPHKYGLKYIDQNGEEQTPVIIHRVIYGSLERFIGLLIEHLAGKFPFWLAPTQMIIIPIAEPHFDYACELKEKFFEEGFRVKTDLSDESLGNRIYHAQNMNIPYMVIVGDQELENNTISIRVRNGETIDKISPADFIELCHKQEEDRNLELIDENLNRKNSLLLDK